MDLNLANPTIPKTLEEALKELQECRDFIQHQAHMLSLRDTENRCLKNLLIDMVKYSG